MASPKQQPGFGTSLQEARAVASKQPRTECIQLLGDLAQAWESPEDPGDLCLMDVQPMVCRFLIYLHNYGPRN